ncbi:MAG: right-handed parallel beta-helix repeat-containing protein [Thermodesulfovibrionales bacterium]
MTRYLLRRHLAVICVIFFLSLSSALAASSHPIGQMPGGAYVDAGSYESINAAVAAARGRTLLISAPLKLSATLLIPADVALHIARGGMLIRTSKYTIAVQGPFTAGYYQVFDGFRQGDVTFRDGSVKEVYPQWWGENTSASINNAINAFPVVYCPPGIYRIESEVLLNSYTELHGTRGKTIFQRPRGTRYTGTNIAGVRYPDPFMIGFYTHGSGNYNARVEVTVEGITVDGNSYNSTDSGRLTGIYMHSGSHIRVIDCTVRNLGRTADFALGTGIVFTWVKGGTIRGCQSYDNSGNGMDLYAYNQDILVTENETYRNGVAGIESEGRIGENYRLPRNRGIVITGNYVHDNAGAPWGAGGMSFGHGILVGWSDNVIVTNNIVSGNVIWIGAITVLGSSDVVIGNNSISRNVSASPVDPTGFGIGVFAQYDVYRDEGVSRNIVIANNSLSGNHNGILIRDAVGVAIEGNVIDRPDSPTGGIICEKGKAGKNVSIRNNVITLEARSTAIGIRSGYEGVMISGNQINNALYGIAMPVDIADLSGLVITENRVESVTYGVFAAAGVSLTDGHITRNVFRNIQGMDIEGKKGRSVVLSSVFVSANIHDKGIRSWDSVGSMPVTGRWKAGDRVLNMSVVEQGVSPNRYVITGWLCTASGSPGTWVELRASTGR